MYNKATVSRNVARFYEKQQNATNLNIEFSQGSAVTHLGVVGYRFGGNLTGLSAVKEFRTSAKI